MCGIVGYVGPQQAEGVVIEGLRRLEYRGYDSAGHRPRPRRQDRLGEAGRQAGQPRQGARRPPAARGRPPASGTPAGPPTAPPTTATRTRTSAPRAGSRWCTTGSSRTSPRCAPSSRRPATSCSPRPTPRSPRTSSRAALAKGGTLTEAMQHVCGRLHGAFTLVAVDAQDPDRVVAARRNSPLVVGVGDGENFLASDVAAFIEHTRDALELGQDQVVTITRDGVEVTDFDGNPAEAQALPRRLGPLGRREGRLRLVHAQGDPRAAARRSPTRCSAATTSRARSSSTSCGSARTSCAASTRSS